MTDASPVDLDPAHLSSAMPASASGRIVIAVPAKNEAAYLTPCLIALTCQENAPPHEILVLINNSSDGGGAVARAVAAWSPVPIQVADIVLPAREANAGGARRRAMRWAAARAGDNGIVLTTDADGVAAPTWLAANLRAIAAGADAVCGRAVLDPADELRLPASLIEADAAECLYAALLDEIAARLDPDPADPWPRHDEHSGASIAVTTAAFRRAGGVPPLPVGEDRALFAALRRVDAKIRHANDAIVSVSGRVDGRAAGGMAETIRRRLVAIDAFLDARLEPARTAIARVRLRRRMRMPWHRRHAMRPDEFVRIAERLAIPPEQSRRALAADYFGAAWEMIEAASPRLRKRLVPAASVRSQIAIARGFLDSLGDPVNARDPSVSILERINRA